MIKNREWLWRELQQVAAIRILLLLILGYQTIASVGATKVFWDQGFIEQNSS